MSNRVVITGLGVVSPNGAGLQAFEAAIKAGKSGIRHFEELAALKFSCCIGGMPEVSEEQKLKYLTPLQLRNFTSSGILYACMAGIDAWKDAGLSFAKEEPHWDSGCVFGTGMSGAEKMREASYKVDSGRGNPYIWAGFDALRVMTYKHNDSPEDGSRPMSTTASGFVPGSGGGALVLESLESALARKAPIYAEVLGGAVNSGGQRQGGTMTAPNSVAVQRCITDALQNSGVDGKDIDLINGHLTATVKDPIEIQNWTEALDRKGKDFPYIHSMKSMIGHCLSGAGSIESVAAVLGLKKGFIFPKICLRPLILLMI